MRKIVNGFILALTAVLIVLPFILHVAGNLGKSSLESGRLIVQLVFVFACLAGIITTAEKKQLNIEVFTSKFDKKIQDIIQKVVACLNIAILTAIFLSVFPNYNMISSEDHILHIPIMIFFSALPPMYLIMLVLEVKRSRCIIISIVGLLLGMLISTGSILGLLNLIFSSWYPEINDSGFAELLTNIFNFMQIFSEKAIWGIVLILTAFSLFGMPLYIVLSGLAYFAFMTTGGYVESIPMETYNILTDTSIAAIPMFTVAGYLLAGGSAGNRLLNFVKSSVGCIRGGVVIASVLVATFFTTFTGASGVTILALGGILSVILTGSGYSEDDSEALITASGSIGLLLPPSLAVIVYGATNFMTVNIFDLFKGSILPGILLALSMITVGIIKDKSSKRIRFSREALFESFKSGFLELLLPILIAVFYFGGYFTLFETAAFTVLYSFILEVFIRKDFTIKKSLAVILQSIPIAGGVLVIIGAAKGLALFLVYAGIPETLSDLAITFVGSKILFLLLLNIVLLIVGCIMDLYSAILVVSPLIIPVAESFGIHPVHTGVIFLTNLALGFLTPPIGMNLFIASYTFKKPVIKIVKNILPYLAVQFIILLLITYIPWFSMIFVK
ncbi:MULTISPECIES: TRAP transporter large permease subunit [unclassified Treponema]|uniref:TRAP transporter large permease subunit n=1 Tax=unclassified Treponema TaxID=2638727 RepID=UPI0020A5A563|nr:MULTISPECIES: TRAP transporter large permease subunit [unclassified Treponema]UTC67494.1 TRAP transporter large permease subunit [Treponema sp. OMZ 789]UTC70222.1 TRAP transporter large permease subunit [Treponema sp. OMZ 790]UTC72937.1 TRAP transporter large permease subunit [Treponema sp. OMZ 791]